MRKHKAEGTFVQRLDHIKAIIPQIWALSLANAQKAGKEVDLTQSGARPAGSQSWALLPSCWGTQELPVWCGDVAAQQPPRSRSSKCVAIFLGFIFLLVSKKWAGGNGFPQSMPRMTQPCLLHELRGRGAVKAGRKDHSWHRVQNVGTAMRTCNGTGSVPGQNVCSCRVFLDQQHPAGQKLRVAAALLVFHPCPGSL